MNTISYKVEAETANSIYNTTVKAENIDHAIKLAKKEFGQSSFTSIVAKPKNVAEVDVEINFCSLGEEVRERMMAPTSWQFEAMISGPNPAGVKGCPMGRSFTSAIAAVADLINRVKMESNMRLDVNRINSRIHSSPHTLISTFSEWKPGNSIMYSLNVADKIAQVIRVTVYNSDLTICDISEWNTNTLFIANHRDTNAAFRNWIAPYRNLIIVVEPTDQKPEEEQMTEIKAKDIVKVTAIRVGKNHWGYTGVDKEGGIHQLRKKSTKFYQFAFSYDKEVSTGAKGLAAHFLYSSKREHPKPKYNGVPRNIFEIKMIEQPTTNKEEKTMAKITKKSNLEEICPAINTMAKEYGIDRKDCSPKDFNNAAGAFALYEQIKNGINKLSAKDRDARKAAAKGKKGKTLTSATTKPSVAKAEAKAEAKKPEAKPPKERKPMGNAAKSSKVPNACSLVWAERIRLDGLKSMKKLEPKAVRAKAWEKLGTDKGGLGVCKGTFNANWRLTPEQAKARLDKFTARMEAAKAKAAEKAKK